MVFYYLFFLSSHVARTPVTRLNTDTPASFFISSLQRRILALLSMMFTVGFFHIAFVPLRKVSSFPFVCLLKKIKTFFCNQRRKSKVSPLVYPLGALLLVTHYMISIMHQRQLVGSLYLFSLASIGMFTPSVWREISRNCIASPHNFDRNV